MVRVSYLAVDVYRRQILHLAEVILQFVMNSSNPIAWVTLAHARTQQAHHDPGKLYAAKLHFRP